MDGLCNTVSKNSMLYTSAEGTQSWAKVAQPGWTAPSKPEEDGECSMHTWLYLTLCVIPLQHMRGTGDCVSAAILLP